MNLLKKPLISLTTALMRFTVGLYGWTDAPKPKGFPKSPYRYWRPMNNGKSIASASLTEAFTACALEGKIGKL